MYLCLIVLSLFPALSRADEFKVGEISLFSINSAITPATYDYLQANFRRLPKDALIIV